MPKLPVVLTIAGSDNSCGAGAQADLKAITALGGYAQTALTCVVAEVPGAVEMIQPLKPALVAAQIRLSFEAFPVAAIKTGMLYSRSIIRRVAAAVRARADRVPVVVDPVMVASSGDPLLEPAAIAAYRRDLFPLATLVTPNLDELRILSEMPCRNLAEMEEAGRMLVDRHGCGFLLKGGILAGRLPPICWSRQRAARDSRLPFTAASIPTARAAPMLRRLPPAWPVDCRCGSRSPGPSDTSPPPSRAASVGATRRRSTTGFALTPDRRNRSGSPGQAQNRGFLRVFSGFCPKNLCCSHRRSVAIILGRTGWASIRVPARH